MSEEMGRRSKGEARPNPRPLPAGGVGRYGRSPGFRIFLLPVLPTRATLSEISWRIPPVQWLFPVSYPVTVAGAAPVSHRLPSKRPSSPDLRERERHRTVWSVKEVPHVGGLGND